MKKLLTLLFSILMLNGFCQSTQTLRGEIKDAESQYPLEFVNIALFKDSTLIKATETDDKGKFKMENIPIGKYIIMARFVGYMPFRQGNIIVTSGKEVVMNIVMGESVVKTKEEVVITATGKGNVRNEMSLVSVRSFNVEETQRYAGSRGDPARMASNFAGVQGNNDSRNDIIVRGNSPLGVLYRFENVDIFNPNHFSISGSTGGPVSILNNKNLANSDFLTSAFTPEYGNAIAGVFDLKMRNGNNEKHEFTGQFGFLGTEFAAEGPLSKKSGASYLINYRYSTLKLFQILKVPIGTDAVPNYQDGAFKLNFPMGKRANLSFFGMGGLSNIDINVSKLTTPPTDIYAEATKDQYFGTGMGVIGSNFGYIISPKTYLRVTLSYNKQYAGAHHELVSRDSNYKFIGKTPVLWYGFNFDKIILSSFINHKINEKNTIKVGFSLEKQGFNLLDSFKPYSTTNPSSVAWQNRWNYKGSTYLAQPYIQWKHAFNERLSLVIGMHSSYYALNNQISIEPRASMRYALSKSSSLNIGYGLHSQTQPTYTYFYHLPQNTNSQMHNEKIGFTKSHHFVIGFDKSVSQQFRIKAETYYQHLFNVPIEKRASSFSLINQGSAFSRFFPDTLQNKGTGDNYGIELTLERFFSKGFFYMMTASVFNSTYKGSDGIRHNTDYNSNYAINALGAYEWQLNKKSIIQLGTKVTYTGGRRYSPIDMAKTQAQGEVMYKDSAHNSLQFHPYFRWDIKILYRYNGKHITQEIGIDIVNVLNTKNLLGFTYSPGVGDGIRKDYQLGRLPLFYYKIDF